MVHVIGIPLIWRLFHEGHNPTGVRTLINLQTEAGGMELYNYVTRCVLWQNGWYAHTTDLTTTCTRYMHAVVFSELNM